MPGADEIVRLFTVPLRTRAVARRKVADDANFLPRGHGDPVERASARAERTPAIRGDSSQKTRPDHDVIVGESPTRPQSANTPKLDKGAPPSGHACVLASPSAVVAPAVRPHQDAPAVTQTRPRRRCVYPLVVTLEE